MKNILQTIGMSMIVIGLALSMFGLIIFGNQLAGPHTRVYNCSIAEISPDIPLEVKQECRKLNAEKINGVSNSSKDRNGQ